MGSLHSELLPIKVALREAEEQPNREGGHESGAPTPQINGQALDLLGWSGFKPRRFVIPASDDQRHVLAKGFSKGMISD